MATDRKWRVAFMFNQFCIRGTEGNMWAYAHYNETMLGNESVIIVRKLPKHDTPDFTAATQEYFEKRFREVHQIDDIEIESKLQELKVDVCMFGCAGVLGDFCPKSVPTISHCVFQSYPMGTVQTAISHHVASGRCPVLPNIVHVAAISETDNMRKELGIPEGAIVYGRYGGYNEFSIPFVHQVIKEVAAAHPNIYFLLMNTNPTFMTDEILEGTLKNIIFVPGTPDIVEKTRFIYTCDAMLHAREVGETFGMSCGEFALCGRPVVTCFAGAQVHINELLREKAIIYSDAEHLRSLLTGIDMRFAKEMMKSGTGYNDCTPDKVMPKFAYYLQQAYDKFHA